MKRKKNCKWMKDGNLARSVAAKGDKIAVALLFCAAGSLAAQDGVAPAEAAPASPEPDVSGELPAEVVVSSKPAPRPRPAPAPQPAPVVVVAPVPEPEPLVLNDSLYQPRGLSASTYTQPLLDVPQTVQIIPEALLRDQGATTLRDALRNVSGISIQAGEGGAPLGDSLSIRGFAARSDIYIDGIRDFGAYSRDPFNLEQIEVAKGPASAHNGRGSTGGSINLVTKSAQLNDFVHSDVSVGSDNLFRATLDINQAIPGIEGAAMRLNVMSHQNDTPGRDYARSERWGIAGSLAFGLGEAVAVPHSGKSSVDGKGSYGGKETAGFVVPNDTRLFLNVFHFEEDNVPDYGIPWVPSGLKDPRIAAYENLIAPVSFDNFYGNLQRDFEETDTSVASARFEHDFNDSLTLRNQVRVGESNRLSVVSSPRFNPASNPAMIRGDDWKDRDEQNSIVSNQTDFVFSTDTGSFHHDGVLGFEFSREENDRFRYDARNSGLLSLYNPDPNAPLLPGRVGRNGDSTHTTATTTAAYLFDTMEVTEWLEFTGGARYDRFDVDFSSVDTTGGTGVSRLGRVDEMVSGQAAVVLKPAENGSIYFGWGTSFNPSGELLSLSDTATATNSINVDPEQNETFEVGTKWNVLDERLSLSAALFKTNKTNARTQDPADPSDFVVLEGEQVVEGFEFGLSGEVTSWWNISTSYTHLDSEVTSSLDPLEVGRELSNTPQNSFSLWNTFDLGGGFFAGGGPVFVDSRFNSTANLREAPSYTTWDAMIGYEVNENLTLRVNVYNLGDEDYLDRIGGGHAVPGAGRSVMFTASAKF